MKTVELVLNQVAMKVTPGNLSHCYLFLPYLFENVLLHVSGGLLVLRSHLVDGPDGGLGVVPERQVSCVVGVKVVVVVGVVVVGGGLRAVEAVVWGGGSRLFPTDLPAHNCCSPDLTSDTVPKTKKQNLQSPLHT